MYFDFRNHQFNAQNDDNDSFTDWYKDSSKIIKVSYPLYRYFVLKGEVCFGAMRENQRKKHKTMLRNHYNLLPSSKENNSSETASRSSEELMEENKWVQQELSDRAQFLEKLAMQIKYKDYLMMAVERDVRKITPTEYALAELVATERLDSVHLEEILTYWVKIHNFLRKFWPLELFHEKSFHFVSDITALEMFFPRLFPGSQYATNDIEEAEEVFSFILKRGYFKLRETLPKQKILKALKTYQHVSSTL